MQFTCKHCNERFDKQLNFKQRIEKYVPEFCSRQCEVTGLRSKKKEKFSRRKRNKTSKEEREFGNILAKFYRGLKRQYRVRGYYHNYDFYVPELGMLVEYSGVYWHSKPNVRKRDNNHMLEAKKRDIPLVVITDSRWKQFLKEGVISRDRIIKLFRENII